MSREPHVDICVPVYNGRAFVAETLAAIQRQRFENLTVLISDDGSDDGSADICRGFLVDRRFRLSIQRSRLGWIGNCNWLLRHATSELVCIVSHDDLPEPDHIVRLAGSLAAEPDCVLAFTDIRVFGVLDYLQHQASIFGSSAQRIRAFIARHYDGAAFHALIRRRAIHLAGGLRGNAMDHFAADVAWLGRLAGVGAFQRVPEPLYQKRRHLASTSLQWRHWSDDRRAEAWSLHCGELLRDGLGQPLTPDEQLRIVHASLRRVLAIEPALPFQFIRELPRDRQASMVATLLADVQHIPTTALRVMAEEDPYAILARVGGEAAAWNRFQRSALG
ncbi:MAG: glycosyltransferase family A protein [Vicinamibacterales bacterium]